jgi:hypothetical protein
MDMTLKSSHKKIGISDDAKFIAELGALAVVSLLISVFLS